MPIPTFTPGYPPDGSSLGQTKSTIRNNLDGTFQTLAIDHIDNNGNPGAKPAGYHKVIHMVPQAANPAPVGGYGELYCRQINSVNLDEALFYESGGGRVAQLTMNVAPSAATNGYSYLPGGILVQWGQVTSTSSSMISENYNIPFPNAVFTVMAQIYGSGSPANGNGNIQIRKSSLSSTSAFQWAMITDSSEYTGFFWVAIGN